MFSCEFCEISKNTFSYRLPPVAASAACNFIKKEIPTKMFSVNLTKFLRTSFDRALPDDCLLSLSVNLRSFSEHLLYRAPPRNCLFHVQVAVFQPAGTVKDYFTGAIQAFYTRTREVAIRRRSFT